MFFFVLFGLFTIDRHVGALDASDDNPDNLIGDVNIAGVDNSQSWNTNTELEDLDFEFDSFGTTNNDDFDLGGGGSVSFGDANNKFGESTEY